MDPTQDTLLAILRIGHEASIRGEGISLRAALSRTDYVNARKHFGAQDLVPVIQAHGELARQWLMYSEDKRTTGGWYVTEAGEVGRLEDSESVERFGSIQKAVAEYVVRELDYWAAA
ncbi:MAG: hypothetical protein ACYC5A_04920 [Thermoleophilia bacterium]